MFLMSPVLAGGFFTTGTTLEVRKKKKKELKAFWSLGESALCHALEACYLMYSDVTNKNEPTPNTESNTNQLLHGFPL